MSRSGFSILLKDAANSTTSCLSVPGDDSCLPRTGSKLPVTHAIPAHTKITSTLFAASWVSRKNGFDGQESCQFLLAAMRFLLVSGGKIASHGVE